MTSAGSGRGSRKAGIRSSPLYSVLMSSTDTVILLRPRPYEISSGTLLLLPLLPKPIPLKPLPLDIWTVILTFAFDSESPVQKKRNPGTWAWSLLATCKSFNASEIALPLLYASIRFSRIEKLEAFYKRLHIADQKWDSIRRIPYSTPGRWVQTLDVSDLVFEGQAQALLLDSLLCQIFPLVPFLSSLSVNPSFVLSRRVLSALAQREGSVNLRSLSGLSYVPPPGTLPDEDPFVNLLRCCPNLEALVVVGQGLDLTELELDPASADLPSLATFKPLYLPRLRILSLLSMHSSPLMLALLHSPLPGLSKLTVTPYHDIPYPASLVSEFIATHGHMLSSLVLLTPKSWPTRLRPSPPDLLTTSPNLNHLSLESPLPSLILRQRHGLKILSIPRPTPDSWTTFERLLPLLPDLAALRARDVHWLKKGISSMAQEAGIQGEMKLWKRRLERRGIRLLDADWHEA